LDPLFSSAKPIRGGCVTSVNSCLRRVGAGQLYVGAAEQDSQDIQNWTGTRMARLVHLSFCPATRVAQAIKAPASH
ncbi:MAG: hypothetical protein ACREXQ_03400, partial [Polaromonas sp.]